MKSSLLFLTATLIVANASADDSTLDAAIGGGIGGAAGAAIGNEVGGRDGAIIGGAVGAAVGAAITTEDHTSHKHIHHKQMDNNSYYIYDKKKGPGFCPPGQAKKGRC